MDQGGYERKPDLRGKRDVEVLRAAPLPRRRPGAALGSAPDRPLAARGVRPVPTPRTPSAFAVWRRTHYVADQVLRVGAIVVGAVSAAGLTLGAVAMLVAWALGQLSALLAGAGGLVVLTVAVALFAVFTRSRSHGHSTTTTVTVTTACKR